MIPTSVLLRHNLGWAAARWAAAGVVVGGLALWLELRPGGPCTLPPPSPDAPDPATSGGADYRAGSIRQAGMLMVWVAVAAARVCLGALLRGAAWAGWNTALPPASQPRVVRVCLRAELMISLAGIMWTTIGFLYLYASSTSLSPCADTALAAVSTSLVALMYVHYASPLLLAAALRLVTACSRCLLPNGGGSGAAAQAARPGARGGGGGGVAAGGVGVVVVDHMRDDDVVEGGGAARRGPVRRACAWLCAAPVAALLGTLQSLAGAGVFTPPTLPASEVQIRKLPCERYRRRAPQRGGRGGSGKPRGTWWGDASR